ncbi:MULTISPECIES: LytR C-terminal domain-containing protein [unclassified Arthrobacter]|uniref:LytR C-terminal domain-containing protein n=1 Tax=unclassified Arthrobacter TaxID=235627 RepID=UPI001D146C69|nr:MULTISPECIES: LytR C-terminal domain-containing protein [unclassified Arthrobacter]MCC3276302.1 LytR C-terminal domain-containing protein [Arthrobacter sp. zg-Y20]MCC9178670.1 LytR C-terminal domain-containing protein [Arthrobacter sp. zg-Y750]MDK1316461.1 LytR C-terminal domain-containing protein [Arthrobacter sp. zg.Y20]WIB06506.1 LytR C-terminal domain-containing protein [Arthrobacter sp. zg-Y20]
MTKEPPDGAPGGLAAMDDRDDSRQWHGHRIVTGGELGAVFAPTDEPEMVRRARRRRRLHNSVIGVLALLLLSAVILAQGLVSGWVKLPAATEIKAPAGPADECPAGPFPYLDPATVTVNIYNSTAAAGLANTVGAELGTRGFQVAQVGNSSVNRAGMTALILSGPSGFASAYTLQQHIPDTEYVRDDRTDASVDMVIGAGFTELQPPEQAAAAGPGALSCPGNATPADGQ